MILSTTASIGITLFFKSVNADVDALYWFSNAIKITESDNEYSLIVAAISGTNLGPTEVEIKDDCSTNFWRLVLSSISTALTSLICFIEFLLPMVETLYSLFSFIELTSSKWEN